MDLEVKGLRRNMDGTEEYVFSDGSTAPVFQPVDAATFKASWIQTRSGKEMYPTAPTADMLDIGDIGHALSMVCRFAGHTRTFYSVAEHSVRVARLVSPEDRLAALLHDASEAYLCDIPKPVKPLLPGYAAIEDRMSRVIADKWGVSYPWPESVKRADRIMLHSEARELMGDPEWARGHETVSMDVCGWEPWYARLTWLDMVEECMA